MDKNIKGIFDSITPDNIRSVPAIKDAMEVFIDTLEELSKESIDVRAVYENEKIKEQFVQTYLNDLYNVIKQVQLNEQVSDSIETLNQSYNIGRDPSEEPIEFIKKDDIQNISDYLTEEHFLAFKSYKQHKGTKESIRYIYDFINGFVSSQENQVDFTINEKGPFHLSMEGGLPAEFYEYIIYPLAHPLGFTYDYTRYISLKLEEYFPELKITYNTNVLEVRCLLSDGTTKTHPFINGVGSDPEVVSIKEIQNPGERVKIVFLSDDTYLKQKSNTNGQTKVWHLEGTPDNYSETDTEITAFTQQCSIYIDYNPVIKTTVQDEQEFGNHYPFEVDGFNYDAHEYLIGQFDIGQNFGSDTIRILGQEVEITDHIQGLIESHEPMRILIEPVYSQTDDFIDYNGVSRGETSQYSYIIDGQDIGDGYYIGGYYDEKSGNLDNPNLEIKTFETLVSGDPVNLQYNTYDILGVREDTDISESVSVDSSGNSVHEDESGSSNIASEILERSDETSLYPERFNYVAHEYLLGEFDIGQNFGSDTIRILGQEVEITETISGVVAANDDIYEHEEIDSTGVPGEIEDSSDNLIGNDWIGNKYKVVQTVGESYVGKEFDLDSDDQLDFGIYRNGALLTDGNISAVS